MTYTAWDAMGRPTDGVSRSRASTVSLKYGYDDAGWTMTIRPAWKSTPTTPTAT